MTTPASFETDKLIRFHHCDPAGIVFYPQYFVLFNELVEDWFNSGLGIDFGDFHTIDRLGVPMAHIECDFLSPSKVGEVLRFRLNVKKIGNSSLTLAVDARAGDEVRVRATLVVVLASLDAHRPVPFPPELREKLMRFEAP
jgi:4-hydroxybenzoyl-CoA thioesterase